jgi:hypothetical protein
VGLQLIELAIGNCKTKDSAAAIVEASLYPICNVLSEGKAKKNTKPGL